MLAVVPVIVVGTIQLIGWHVNHVFSSLASSIGQKLMCYSGISRRSYLISTTNAPSTRLALESVRNLLLNQEKHENENDCIESGAVVCRGSGVLRQRRQRDGHVEAERGEVEVRPRGAQEQHRCLRGCG